MRLRLPSPALVVASLALLVALGGTGYAAVALSERSVGTVHLRDGAVTSPKVRNGALGVVDLAPAARRALAGRPGPQGPAGPKGDPGATGLTGVETVGASTPFDSNDTKTLVVRCPEGKRLVGGGAGAWGRAMIWMEDGVALVASHPHDDSSWLAAARELIPTEKSWFLRANAICATVQ